MPTIGTPNPVQTFDTWFNVTIKILKTRMAKLGVRDTGSLFESLSYQLDKADDLVSKGYLIFFLYGKFVDMGVGREFSLGNMGVVSSKRKRKEWYSRAFYAQVMRLREIMQTSYGENAAKMLVRQIEAVQDLKYQAYRQKDLARNARNYRKQILLPPGQSTWTKVNPYQTRH